MAEALRPLNLKTERVKAKQGSPRRRAPETVRTTAVNGDGSTEWIRVRVVHTDDADGRLEFAGYDLVERTSEV